MEKYTYFIVYLEDSLHDAQSFTNNVYPQIREKTEQFLWEVFPTSKDGADGCPRISLAEAPIICRDLTAFRQKLIRPAGWYSEEGQRVLFFILDLILDNNPLIEQVLDSLPFPEWLRTHFPAVPTFALTALPERAVQDLPWNWHQKDVFLNPQRISPLIDSFLKRAFEPEFLRELLKYADGAGSISWHTPGHNAGTAFRSSPFQRGFYNALQPRIFSTDLSVSVNELGDLSEPDCDSPLSRSQGRCADIFGALKTYYITNGTSTSNKALLTGLLRPGEVVLLDRNCHKSVHQAIVLAGAIPLYLMPALNTKFGIWSPIDLETLRAYLSYPYGGSNPLKPRLLVLTTCTYEGMLYPLDRIASWCHEHGILLLADEAWAPYLRFHNYYLRSGNQLRRLNALDAGADFAVHSIHKVLAAFSQASALHVGKAFKASLESGYPRWEWLRQRFPSWEKFCHHLQEMLRYWHSTSPQYLLLASLDSAACQMRLEGTALLNKKLREVLVFAEEVDAFCQAGGGCILTEREIVGEQRLPAFGGFTKDPLKLLLGVRDGKRKLETVFRDERIRWEKATDNSFEFLVTIGTLGGDLQKLQGILRKHKEYFYKPSVDVADFDTSVAQADVLCSPGDATIGPTEYVPLDEGAGRIAAQMLVPYPPGIPVLLPGIGITHSVVDLVRKVVRDRTEEVSDVHGLYGEGGKWYLRVIRDRRTPGNPRQSRIQQIWESEPPATRINKAIEEQLAQLAIIAESRSAPKD